MNRPIVCQLLHTLNVGGAEVLAARLGRRLREQCHFIFVCLEEAGTLAEELRQEGFTVHVMGRRPGLDLGCAWRLGRLLRREKIDVLHAHQYTPFSYAMVGRFPWGRPPILFTEHGRHQPDYPRRKRMIFNRVMLGRRDRVVAVGEAVRQALIVNEGIAQSRIEVVYNGIDAEQFTSRPEDRSEVRRSLGLAEDEFVVIQVARLDYLKDHATAIRTMARLSEVIPNARLLLVGEGPEEKAIRAQVEQLGLGQVVRFLGLRKDVSRLYRAADLFLLTSISEGIPLTILEAMCTGLPVISTAVGGTAEVVREGETGFLAPAGDDGGLAEAVLRLTRDPKLRQTFGERGQRRARESFAEATMATRYHRLYEEMARV